MAKSGGATTREEEPIGRGRAAMRISAGIAAHARLLTSRLRDRASLGARYSSAAHGAWRAWCGIARVEAGS